jgi:hypothetical protein
MRYIRSESDFLWNKSCNCSGSNKGLYVRCFRFVLIALFLFGFASPAFSQEFLQQESTNTTLSLRDKLKRQQQLVMKSRLTDGRDAIISVNEIAETTAEEAGQLLQDPNVKGSDILLSTDKEQVIETFVKDNAASDGARKLRIIPIGALASAKQKMAAGFNQYISNVKATVTGDKIGLLVLSITVGTDCFMWIHASSFSIHQQTSMIMMNLVMAATFGLDPDLWGNMNKPIREKMIDVFDRFIPADKLTVIKSLTSRYLSNMLMGVGVQVVRTGLLSLDHIQDAVMTGSFWGTAAKISALVTLTTFAWSELSSSIDAERNPIAKLMLKRFKDSRGLIMCQLASISMVLQPHVYGNVPIYSFLVHGAVGLVAFMNAHRVVNWLETSPTAARVYRKVQTMENFMDTALAAVANAARLRRAPVRTEAPVSVTSSVRNSKPVVRSCRALLAG